MYPLYVFKFWRKLARKGHLKIIATKFFNSRTAYSITSRWPNYKEQKISRDFNLTYLGPELAPFNHTGFDSLSSVFC